MCVKGLKKDNDDGVKMYEEYVKQRKIFIYNTVKVQDDDVIKYDYNVLPARGGLIHTDQRAQEV